MFMLALSFLDCGGYHYLWELSKIEGEPQKKIASPISFEMIGLPANIGGFSRGYGGVLDATPTHIVASITTFTMGKYEITYHEWNSVLNWASMNGYSIANPGAGSASYPVLMVSWRDAIVWCNAASEKDGLTPVYYVDNLLTTVLKASTNTAILDATPGSQDNPYTHWSANGYRLPTDAEFEYAARYIDGSTFLRGDAPSGWLDNNPTDGNVDATEIDDTSWWANNAGSANPVGQKLPNVLGIYDMSGNVAEWVWDWYGNYSNTSPYTDADSKGPSTGLYKTLRGGQWNNSITYKSSSRYGTFFSPWQTDTTFGFRVARRP